jgi:hypothetical protein
MGTFLIQIFGWLEFFCRPLEVRIIQDPLYLKQILFLPQFCLLITRLMSKQTQIDGDLRGGNVGRNPGGGWVNWTPRSGGPDGKPDIESIPV